MYPIERVSKANYLGAVTFRRFISFKNSDKIVLIQEMTECRFPKKENNNTTFHI